MMGSIPFYERYATEYQALCQEIIDTAVELTGVEPTALEIRDLLDIDTMVNYCVGWDCDAYEARYHAKNPEA